MLYRIVKRTLDIFLGSIFWIIFSPLLLIISILVKISDRGEVFVSNPKRRGLSKKYFFMYKFRTMIPNANDIKLNKKKKKEWEKNHKVENDNRVTKIGRILRDTDLDELPQLINVLIGNMSLVGYRPLYDEEISHHLDKYPEDIKYFNTIFKYKPGLTGIWQISGRNSISFRDRLKMESEYYSQENIFKDIYILLLTPYVVISRKGVKGKNV